MAKHFVHLLVVALCCGCLLLSSRCDARTLAQAQSNDKNESSESKPTNFIVIESVLPEPDETHFETVLIRNTGPDPVDVSGWKLINAVSKPELEYVFPSETLLVRGASMELTSASSPSDDDGSCE